MACEDESDRCSSNRHPVAADHHWAVAAAGPGVCRGRRQRLSRRILASECEEEWRKDPRNWAWVCPAVERMGPQPATWAVERSCGRVLRAAAAASDAEGTGSSCAAEDHRDAVDAQSRHLLRLAAAAASVAGARTGLLRRKQAEVGESWAWRRTGLPATSASTENRAPMDEQSRRKAAAQTVRCPELECLAARVQGRTLAARDAERSGARPRVQGRRATAAAEPRPASGECWQRTARWPWQGTRGRGCWAAASSAETEGRD